MFSIRTTYPDSICYRPDGAASDSIAPPFLLGSPDSMAARVLLGNLDGVDPDSLAGSVSSGREVPTPCTRRQSPLRSIAHSTRGRILSSRLSTFSGHFISGKPCADILHLDVSCAPTFYIRISHIRMGEEDVSTSPVRHIRIH